MLASTIGGINLLPESEKRAIYSRMVPRELAERFHIPALDSVAGELHARFRFAPGSSDMEMYIFHQPDFPDPIMYGHLTDTLSSQIHILFYILNDPSSPRFDVDRMPDGSSTRFGTLSRNLAAEEAAMNAGLAPGQVRSGLRLLAPAIATFEQFVTELGHDIYFAEPLYYHNAIIFERYGFNYQSGRRLMEQIETGFGIGGEFHSLLDGSTPFRQSNAAGSIRRRSWAIHDGIMGVPFTNVTMYKRVGKSSGISTCPTCAW
jgi:hypothetical protein